MPNEVVNINSSIAANVELPQSYVESSQATQTRVVTSGGSLSVAATFNQNGQPKPAKIVDDQLTIGASATLYDLTAAKVVGAVDGSGQPAATEDLTGRKMFTIVLKCPASNTGHVKVNAASTNGYPLFGVGGIQNIEPGDTLQIAGENTTVQRAAVAANAKDIEFSGTQNDVIQIHFTFE